MSEIRTAPLREDMLHLLQVYPRETWESHPGFRQKTRNWLGAHRAFLYLADLLCEDAEQVLQRRMSPEQYQARLAQFGSRLIGNLHGHHRWEDRAYFPELKAADNRFERALTVLEKDHLALDKQLHTLTSQGNLVLRIDSDARDTLITETGRLYPALQSIKSLLDRHLGDEEDVAVPIILHYRLRG